MSERNRVRDLNTDLLGDTWFIAPDGHRQLGQSKATLWNLRHELLALSGLFRSLGPETVLSEKELYGLGISLARISGRIGKVHDRLERAEAPAPGPSPRSRSR